MTYLQFHLLFVIPPLAALLLSVRGASRVLGHRAIWVLPAVAAIALIYTTAWDNYLVYRGVWSYGADRVLGVIGYVPIEEYVFFLLQPLLTGAWTYAILMHDPVESERPGRRSRVAARARRSGGVLGQVGTSAALGAAVYVLLAAVGVFALTIERGLYLGLILVWAAPVLALQWPFIARLVSAAPAHFAGAVAAPTVWLWFADRIAIGAGIWSISERYTTGAHILGLPMEEALFFLVTNLLVVQGVLLFLQPALVAPQSRRHAQPA